MKVVKRDGRIVSYDRQKIVAAIENANRDVNSSEQASMGEIKNILACIEDLNKNRILVEDIQEIITNKLVEFNKPELVNKYNVFKCEGTSTENGKEGNNSILGILINDRQLIS